MLLFDDLFGCTRHKIGIAKLGVDFGHFLSNFLKFFRQAPLLGRNIDNAFEGKSRNLAANNHLGRLRRGLIGEGNIGKAGQTLQHIAPSASAFPRGGRCTHQHQRHQRAAWHIDFTASRANFCHKVNEPTNFGLGIGGRKALQARPFRQAQQSIPLRALLPLYRPKLLGKIGHKRVEYF